MIGEIHNYRHNGPLSRDYIQLYPVSDQCCYMVISCGAVIIYDWGKSFFYHDIQLMIYTFNQDQYI